MQNALCILMCARLRVKNSCNYYLLKNSGWARSRAEGSCQVSVSSAASSGHPRDPQAAVALLWHKAGMGVRRRTPAIGACALAAASLLTGCDKHDAKPHEAPVPVSPGKSAPKPAPAPPAATRSAPADRPPAASNEKDEAPHADDALANGKGPYVIDELSDVGPAGPATAGAQGVVMVTRDGAVAVAKLDAAKLAHAKQRPVATPIAPVEQGPAAFVALARGPALQGGYAYWIRAGKLLRHAVDGGDKPEVLASDARDGTRVASAPDGKPPAVAYIAHGAGGLRAHLWVQGSGTIDISPDAAGANSIALARTDSGLVAVSLAGRTAMSPVHARTITFDGNKPKLGKDVVVWVGGASQPLTELSAVAAPDSDVWAFLPLERDITRFGLARIDVGTRPTMNATVTWRAFPNGLDPAPLATARVCGKAVVLYTRPAEATPGSPQELHLAALDGDKLGAPVLVARAGAFSNVSVAALVHGALVAYVADRRTWARTLRCQQPHRH